MGWHGYHISAFSLDECVVPAARVLGNVGAGFETMMESVNSTRLYIAARCVGAAQELLRLSADYAVTRRTFGSRLGDHQAIQFMDRCSREVPELRGDERLVRCFLVD